MELVCYREGRQGYHIGDTVNVPDDATTIDATYFRVVEKPPVKRDPEPAVADKEEESEQ
jgi:hypothetical protein